MDATLVDQAQDHESSDLPALKWAPCITASWPTGHMLPNKQVACTTVSVPRDHDLPAAGLITLGVARQKSKGSTGKAMFYLAGGPGGTAVALSGVVPYYYSKLANTFDLVYVDQRGTWSSGELKCSGGFPQSAKQWSQCAAEQSNIDLNHYMTLDAVRDLEYVRKSLGYKKVHLVGASYGSRVGLEYIRQYPHSVAAAVLDGVAPPDWDIFGYNVVALTQALKLLVDDCAKSSACLTASPNLKGDLETRRLKLKQAPQKISFGGSTYYEDDTTFAMFLYLCLDSAALRYGIPRALHKAVKGDLSTWYALVSKAIGSTVKGLSSMPRVPPSPRFRPRLKRGLGGSDSPALMATVCCAEWFPNSGGLAVLEKLRGQQHLADDFMLDMGRSCSSWKVNPLKKLLRAPVKSDVKALLLSGAIDLHTPPDVGKQAAKTLSSGTHVVIPHAGHSSISPCTTNITTAFLNGDGDMKSVDLSCLKQLKQPAW